MRTPRRICVCFAVLGIVCAGSGSAFGDLRLVADVTLSDSSLGDWSQGDGSAGAYDVFRLSESGADVFSAGQISGEDAAQGYFDLVTESMDWSGRSEQGGSLVGFLDRALVDPELGEQLESSRSFGISEEPTGDSADSAVRGFTGRPDGSRAFPTYNQIQRAGFEGDQLYLRSSMLLEMKTATVPAPGSALLAMFGFAGLAFRRLRGRA